MPQQTITIIIARADNGVIGRDGALPWRLPADLKRFKRLTMGAPMIMGRKTFESFPSQLPGRRHIVLTRDLAWRSDGAKAVHSVAEALEVAGPGPVWVIGGAEIVSLFRDIAHRIELTEIHAAPDGDTVAEAFNGWREISREDHAANGEYPAYSFVTLLR